MGSKASGAMAGATVDEKQTHQLRGTPVAAPSVPWLKLNKTSRVDSRGVKAELSSVTPFR